MGLEPGGYADKLGNRYEARWVVKQLFRVLNETLKSVTIERIGNEEEGVDLWIEKNDGSQIAQQCKIRNGGYDKWTIADLARRDILSHAQKQLDSNCSNEFALITTIPSTILHDICLSARHSTGNAEEFYQYQIQKIGEDRRKVFTEFCSRLQLDSNSKMDRAKAYSFLKRFFVELWPDITENYETLKEQAQALVLGEPDVVIAALSVFAIDHIREKIDAPVIWAYLEEKGFHPRKLSHDLRIYPQIKKLQEAFADSIGANLVAGELIHREETQKVYNALQRVGFVVLHTNPGYGKSGILFELTEIFKDKNIAYLPIRLDRQDPQNSTKQFGENLGLPESPTQCLQAIAGDKPAVLVLDQLDAIRWTSRHSCNALQVCKDLIREIRGLRDSGTNISVVMACRTYDKENDPEIRGWLDSEKYHYEALEEIKVAPLDVEIIKQVVKKISPDSAELTGRQLKILESPQHLAMWVTIARKNGIFNFQNSVQLMKQFWSEKRSEFKQKGYSEAVIQSVLSELIDYMELRGHISAPMSIVSNTEVLDILQECGIIQKSDNRITFCHQSYLDFQIARRVVQDIYKNHKDICQWLGSKEKQSLFRREQLRQALCLLAEEDSDYFIKSVRHIISSDEIRFILKHLCLEVIGLLNTLSEELIDYILELLDDDCWYQHIFSEVFFNHVKWIECLIEKGVISEWLESSDRNDKAFWLLRSVINDMQDPIATLLQPYLNKGEEWQEKILACMMRGPENDSDLLFELRIELAKRGVFEDYIDWSKLKPLRILVLLDAVLSSLDREEFPDDILNIKSNSRSRFENWTQSDTDAILKAVQQFPEKAYAISLKHIMKFVPDKNEENKYGLLELWMDSEKNYFRQGKECIPHGLVLMAIESGKILASDSKYNYWELTEPLRSCSSSIIQYILMETYSSLCFDKSDKVIEWFLENNEHFRIGTGESEPEWMPAVRLISTHSPYCSDDIFNRLESSIIYYHSPDEKRDAEFYLSDWKRGYYGDYWGRTQYFLLPALASRRRSSSADSLIGVLERKYSNYSKERFLTSSILGGGTIGSSLPEDLRKISDKSWIELLSNNSIPVERGRHWKQINDEYAAESSIWHFARDLQNIARRFPERFGRLALKLEGEIHPSYKDSLIEGLKQINTNDIPANEKASWEPAKAELVEKVLAKFGNEHDRQYAKTFCWLIYYRATEAWSYKTLEQLKDYACNSYDPRPSELHTWDTKKGNDIKKCSSSSLYNNTLNCVRGVAGLAIGELMRQQPELFKSFMETIQCLCEDPHPAVRIGGIEACLCVLDIDKQFAIEQFVLASEKDLRVAASRPGVHFFNYGIVPHFDLLSPLILKMLASEYPDVSQEGAEEVTARWIFNGYFQEEIENILANGTVPHRKGAAQVAAVFASKEEYSGKCTKIINILKNDVEKEVRDELRTLARGDDILKNPNGIQILLDFIDSEAFRDDPTLTIMCLEDYSGNLLDFSNVLFSMFDQFKGPLKDCISRPGSRLIWDIQQYSSILLRLYEQAHEIQNTEIINKCLDIFDGLFEHRIGGFQDIIKVVG